MFSLKFIRFFISLVFFISYAPLSFAEAEHPLLVFGDSLSAEYGMAQGLGWVALLEKRLNSTKLTRQKNIKVINASISGETSTGGLARLPALLSQYKPKTVIIELGANDALRGTPLWHFSKNLSAMVELSQKAGAKVLIIGMQIPPNYGATYSDQFAAIFKDVSQQTKAALLPFFFSAIHSNDNYFQADRMHPNESAQQALLDTVWPALWPLLQ